MGLETATYISQLVATNPTSSDPVSQGDDHLQLIKSVLQAQFTTLGAAAVTTTAAELNLLDGKTTLATEGTAVLSTGETVTTKFLRTDGDGTSSWQIPAGTTYTAGDGLDLTGTAFSTDLKSNGGLEIDSTELAVAQGISQYDVAQFTTGVVDDDFLRISTTSVEGRSASEVLSDIAALPLAGGTMTGETIFADQLATRPKMKDYSEAVNALGTKTAAFDIDLEDGNVHSLTIGSGTFNVGLTNALASNSNSITLIGTNLAAGTPSFVSGAHGGGGNAVKWPGGSAPTLTASGVDILTFTTFDGGTNWYGFAAGIDAKAP
jgi:hypothetical protein